MATKVKFEPGRNGMTGEWMVIASVLVGGVWEIVGEFYAESNAVLAVRRVTGGDYEVVTDRPGGRA